MQYCCGSLTANFCTVSSSLVDVVEILSPSGSTLICVESSGKKENEQQSSFGVLGE